ncbi:YaiI/YqxD family protein [Legionella geestiana]|uniref:YaiI/YqxD family protein n=1 Tax=Legionella geestiana TaxID=45065 RepID=UPI00048B251C|nr:YaiI/YqxD family protein [Legionella geestiana]QBS13472.1 YaiI/YqxD family protein [Legionella geestiana]QDQ39259.1 YaiI/YqxD family protein [Legionella geestiana]
MNIWIDGDACPRAIRDILFRAATRRRVAVIMVANHLAQIPPSPFIRRVKVEAGFDAADNYIALHVKPHDLVITADIPLADAVVKKQAIALNPRGTLYTANNIGQVLTARHVNESLRESGMIKSHIDSLTPKEIQSFSNHLDRLIQTR